MRQSFKNIFLLLSILLMTHSSGFGKSILRLGNVNINGDTPEIILPLYLTNGEEIAGFEFTISDDSAAVKIDSVRPSGRAAGFTAVHRNNKVILFSLTGSSVAAGEDKIADIFATLNRENLSGADTVRFTAGTILADRAGESLKDLQTIAGVIFNDLISGIDKQNGLLPADYALRQNYPNPFNSTTVLKYELPETAEIELIIYNNQGQIVRVLGSGRREAGTHQIRWDGRNDTGRLVASGVYLCTFRVRGKNIVLNRKMIFLR